jgi:hypothetical protein
MTETDQAAGLPTTSKALCAIYALIAIAALVATGSQNLQYLGSTNFISAFFGDTKVNAASRSMTVDIFLLAVPVSILMVVEARKHGIKFVWAYIVGAFITALSVTFPLFLIARELHIAKTDPTRLRAADAIPLALFGIGVAAFTIWVAAV